MAKDHYKLPGAKLSADGCKGCGKRPLSSFDWMADLSKDVQDNRYIEVQFKNTRKVVFTNPLNLELHKDDIVAVEGSPGFDVGSVTLTGTLAALRYRRMSENAREQVRQIFRLATPNDIERWEEAKQREHTTMIKARQIAEELGLDMKIGDVEYQGDGSKAIFYYIADSRVDFRKLIRVLAETFHVRIEMKQIGARQEAGRIGGIGPCGRPLCCAQWMTTFKSVNTTAARFQELTLNPEKLTGQCAKLKCCTNFEVNTYLEAQKKMPPKNIVLSTQTENYRFVKWDLLRLELTYVPEGGNLSNSVTLSLRRVREIIEMNKRGEKPEVLLEEVTAPTNVVTDILEANSITRFDGDKRRSRKKRLNNKPREGVAQTASEAPKEVEEKASAEPSSSEERPQQSRRRNNSPRNAHRTHHKGSNTAPNEGNPQEKAPRHQGRRGEKKITEKPNEQ
ncbi:PSP1 domain-containing protein [Porphyromonas circumdentaria]|uniref:Cell fate regulator YaaT, PSP1 superfamily (Controls sporulation, competence, biofilm development) n=1 Tax=Porphyromonas circumdentaria TaxID=29524 RepID=A0A1T4MN45_9PORP|nr:regulatory iron-sulfur-containing complex subunit RicT [Porphyromonas circumdentaria]MBB6275890.1 cell fate regulator YaaT (PSP1 superfamily) [Porphyromonas circumdentaria]MDO4722662.1 regulatory iron-sulfur-containing complex subunit RicT [Porphyromonas circumdentaria]SJZ68432.1 Cell fate regulator YaaT, PSP1 superfamily (controls sporulation, competence, biofilm development) [Porphyromonas circumdentaria]